MVEPQTNLSEDQVHNVHVHLFSSRHLGKKWLIILLVLLVIVIGGYVYVSNSSRGEPQTVTVTGKAVVDALTDKAIITASIYKTTTATDQNTAIENGKKDVENIKAALAAQGMPQGRLKVISTSTEQSYSGKVSSAYPTPTPLCVGACPVPTAYPLGIGQEIITLRNYVNQTDLEITLQKGELDKEDQYIQVLTNANTDPYVEYYLSSTEQYNSQLQEKAIQDAKKKAESIAKINKASIKKVLSVEQSGGDSYGGEGDSSETKEIKLTGSYNVKYELTYPFLSF